MFSDETDGNESKSAKSRFDRGRRRHFDNEYDALDDPDQLVKIFRQLKSQYGVYAVYGNHDIDEKILAGFTFGSGREKKVSDPRMDEFVKGQE